MYDLERFLDSQNWQDKYLNALSEIKVGKKKTHWMWFVFPQLVGLGSSPESFNYAIKSKQEAIDYLNHPILGPRLIEITTELLKIENSEIQDVFGYVDSLKLKSSMTLFHLVSDNSNSVFIGVINKFYHGNKDARTLEIWQSFVF
jgi:uncharacterized protein (DUF1810 family)